MVFPVETLNCFDLPPVRAGGVKLRALTIGDVVLLARSGIDALAPMQPWASEAAFALLANRAGAARPFRRPRFMRLRCTARQRLEAVSRTLDIAFRNAVPGHVDGERTVFHQTGYGWPLEMAERLMHEYGMRFDEAAALPLVRAYSLLACARIRGGGKAGGPDYFERTTVEGLKHG